MKKMLEIVGTSLYGQQWQSSLARELNVNDRTMRRWACGETPPPARLSAELLQIVRARGDNLRQIEAQLLRVCT
jgi:transposase-like protein